MKMKYGACSRSGGRRRAHRNADALAHFPAKRFALLRVTSESAHGIEFAHGGNRFELRSRLAAGADDGGDPRIAPAHVLKFKILWALAGLKPDEAANLQAEAFREGELAAQMDPALQDFFSPQRATLGFARDTHDDAASERARAALGL